MFKKITLRLLFVILIGLLALAVPGGPGAAQQNITLSSLQIDLWPEYDHPSTLVVYRIALPPEVALPALLTFRIPAAAGEPNAVAVRDVTGAAFNVAYTREVQGEWAVITFQATLPSAQLEYYDPGLELEGANRHYVYHWPGDYAVKSALIIVQNPLGATDLQTIPRLATKTQDPSGLIYFGQEIGAMEAGQTFDVTLDYAKETTDLTVDFLNVQPSTPIDADTPGRVNLTDLLPWGLGLAGVLLVAGGAYYWVAGRNRAVPRPAPRNRHRRADAAAETADAQENGVFCHQCGKRTGSGDRFCRSCGTKLH